MIKKIFAILLSILTGLNACCWAKVKSTPLNIKEKAEYVNIDFFSGFDDDNLCYYIQEAIKNNHDARKASWQVEEYRQNIKYSFAQELPHLSVSANYLGVHVPRLDNFQLTKNAFILPFIASYEPDFFLKNRDKTKSSKKAYESSKYQEKSIYISLVSDTAAAYINVLQYDKLIELQEEILKIKQQEFIRDTKKFNQGVINNQEYNTIKKEYETQKNNLETFKKNRDITLTQLALLTGKSPDCISTMPRSTLDSFEYHCTIPSEICSDVIFSRPDVSASEMNLQKAKIDVRVARKEFLPRFNITGIWAFNTIAPGSFFSWESSLAAILAGATQDIFMGGMKLANLRIQKARYEQLFEDYNQVTLNAVKEVNDALCIIKHDTQTDNNTLTYLSIQQNDYQNMARKYSRGVIAYTELLEEQERLINIEQNQTQTKTARLVNYLTLYKAAGGKL